MEKDTSVTHCVTFKVPVLTIIIAKFEFVRCKSNVQFKNVKKMINDPFSGNTRIFVDRDIAPFRARNAKALRKRADVKRVRKAKEDVIEYKELN